MVTARRAVRLAGSIATDEQPFVADPPPALPPGDGGEVMIWALRQFEAIQRTQALAAELTAQRLGALELAVLDLQDRVAVVEDIAGNGTWDGGAP